jgi:hypothetical protein
LTVEKYRDRLLRAARDFAEFNGADFACGPMIGDVAYLAEVDAVLGEIADAREGSVSQPPDIGNDIPGGGVNE